MRVKLMLFLLLSVFLFCGTALALDLGSSITIYDNRSSANTSWYGQQEDEEVEPGMQTGQVWDLEGFFLNGSTLTVVGGFDFKSGHGGYDSGDIFIDVNGDAIYGDDAAVFNEMSGNGVTTITNLYGYDYVLDLNFTYLTYNVFELNSSSLLTVFYDQNEGSNPWRYASGGTPVTGWENVGFSFYSGLGDSDVDNLSGGSHYAFAVDLGFLPEGTEFISHFTIECGNDNLMGQGTLAPEPASMLLVGTGLIGLAGLVRRKVRTRKSS